MTRTTVRPRPARVRLVAVSLVAVGAAAAGLSACDSVNKPSVASIEAKIKTESDFSGASQAQLDCLANVIHKYGTASSLNEYVKGKISADDLKTTNKDDATKATTACVSASE